MDVILFPGTLFKICNSLFFAAYVKTVPLNVNHSHAPTVFKILNFMAHILSNFCLFILKINSVKIRSEKSKSHLSFELTKVFKFAFSRYSVGLYSICCVMDIFFRVIRNFFISNFIL